MFCFKGQILANSFICTGEERLGSDRKLFEKRNSPTMMTAAAILIASSYCPTSTLSPAEAKRRAINGSLNCPTNRIRM